MFIKTKKDKQFTIRLTKEQRDFIKAMAEARGLSMSDLVLRLLEDEKQKVENK